MCHGPIGLHAKYNSVYSYGCVSSTGLMVFTSPLEIYINVCNSRVSGRRPQLQLPCVSVTPVLPWGTFQDLFVPCVKAVCSFMEYFAVLKVRVIAPSVGAFYVCLSFVHTFWK